MIGFLAAFASAGGGPLFLLNDLTEIRAQAVGDVITGFRLVNDGTAQSGDGNPTISWNNNPTSEWMRPLDTATAALYEVQAVEVSRADPGLNAVFVGVMGAWIALNINREWTLTQIEDVTINAEWVFDITIRNVVSQAVVASGRVTLQSQVI